MRGPELKFEIHVFKSESKIGSNHVNLYVKKMVDFYQQKKNYFVLRTKNMKDLIFQQG